MKGARFAFNLVRCALNPTEAICDFHIFTRIAPKAYRARLGFLLLSRVHNWVGQFIAFSPQVVYKEHQNMVKVIQLF